MRFAYGVDNYVVFDKRFYQNKFNNKEKERKITMI